MQDKYKQLLVILGLIVTVVAVFWQVHSFEFINYDDDKYVSENPHISTGLKWDNIVWVFTSQHVGNWHPLTGLSHILDCQLFGANAGPHHVVNMLFHIVNTLLLFIVLRQMTGAVWQSAFVAAAFALHPLHIESVAWISERKDMLSSFFWIFTMGAYCRYIKNPKTSRYLLTIIFFVFGLMSKPMVVTLPFVLLLLDYWPLNRLDIKNKWQIYHLIIEKIPFFILAAVSSVVTFIVQRSAGAVREIEVVPFMTRAANAVISYVKYIEKMFVPARLAAFYPYPAKIPPVWQILAAALLLLLITILVIRLAARYKYLLVGWFWYLGTLVPVIGLVLVGDQAMADRYTYVPLTGLFIIIAWTANDLLAKSHYRKAILSFLTLAIISTLFVCAFFQTRHWRNSQSLFEHAMKVTDRNYLAYNNLGLVMIQQGKINEAIDHFRHSLLIKPDYIEAINNLAFVYSRLGLTAEAMAASKRAIEIKPQYGGAYCNLARAYNDLNQPSNAIYACKKALSINPDFAEAYCNLGVAYGKLNKSVEATESFGKAIKLKPGFTEAYYNLGAIYAQLGRFENAIDTLKQAVRTKPDYAEAHYALAISYLMAGNKNSAMAEYEILKKLNPEKANALLEFISKQANP